MREFEKAYKRHAINGYFLISNQTTGYSNNMKIIIFTVLFLLIAAATAAEADGTSTVSKTTNIDVNNYVDSVERAVQAEESVADLSTASHSFRKRPWRKHKNKRNKRKRRCFLKWKKCWHCYYKTKRYCKKRGKWGKCKRFGYYQKPVCYYFNCKKRWVCPKW